MGARILLITTILLKVVTSQRIPCSCQRPANEIIETVPILAGSTDALCKDLAAAIQGIVVSKLQTNAARTPVFSQISQPLIDEISTSLNCPVCSSVNILPGGYSTKVIQSNSVPNLLNTGNNVCSCSKPVTGFANTGNNLVPSLCSCSNVASNTLSTGGKVCGCAKQVSNALNIGNSICDCGKTVAINTDGSFVNSPCSCSSCSKTTPGLLVPSCGFSNSVSGLVNSGNGLVNSQCSCSNSVPTTANNVCSCSKSLPGLVNTANGLLPPCGCANSVSNNVRSCSKTVSGPANRLISPSCRCGNSVSNTVNNACSCSKPVSELNVVNSQCRCSDSVSNGAFSLSGCSKIPSEFVNLANSLAPSSCRCANSLSNSANNVCGCTKSVSGLVNVANNLASACSCANSNTPPCNYCNSLVSSNAMQELLNTANNLATSITNSVISRSVSSSPPNLVSPNNKYSELLSIVNGFASCPCKAYF